MDHVSGEKVRPGFKASINVKLIPHELLLFCMFLTHIFYHIHYITTRNKNTYFILFHLKKLTKIIDNEILTPPKQQ